MFNFVKITKSFFDTLYSQPKIDKDPPTITYENGRKEWWIGEGTFKEGEWIRHRENAPAVIYPGVGEDWFYQGQLHRDGGPAIDYVKHKEWYKHGKRHRLDGPALETTDETEVCMKHEWWIEGIQYSEDEFKHEIAKKKLNTSLDIELIENTQQIKKLKL